MLRFWFPSDKGWVYGGQPARLNLPEDDWMVTVSSQNTSDLIAAYERGSAALSDAVSGMSEDELRARPIEGKWSALEVVCHVADFELVNADRIQRVIAEDMPTLFNAEPDLFAARLGYATRDVADELRLIEVVRRHISRVLRAQGDEVWSRKWIHSTDGPKSLQQLVERVTRHIEHHIPFIAEKRAVLARQAGRSEKASAPPRHDSQYLATISWSRSGPDFVKGRFSREHTWTFDGGVTVPASPSPHVVPAPWSNAANVDPEEAFVASVASCHMLTFLWLASREGFQADRYSDAAVGIMTKNERNVLWVSHVTLRPQIDWSGDRLPSPADIERLHHQAHLDCFIANSVKTTISVDS
jgi:organic hydroperoxide reductase OsmC/OhrA